MIRRFLFANPTAVRLLLAGLAGYLLFFQTTFLVPDSSGTYAWARSLLFDGDVDFSDEFARLGSIPGDATTRFHALTATGRPGNPFGMGSGVLWMPFLLIAQAGLALTGATAEPPGYSTAHLLAVSTGTVLLGLAALLLSLVVARSVASRSAAAWAVGGAALGSSFLAYLFHLPTYSHVPAAFGVALALAASLRARRQPGGWSWGLAGAAAGLAALIRAQNVALLAVVAALWLARWRDARSPRAKLRDLAALGIGFAAVFSLQLLAWWRIYGTAWEVPQGRGFLHLARPHLVELLFSPWNGLFSWAPLLLVAVPGLVLLWRKDPFLGAGVGATLLAEAWVAASVPDWWAGYTIGARRFVDLTPVFVLGLACAFTWIETRLRGRWGALTVRLLCGAGVLWNLLLTLRVEENRLRPHLPIGWGELLSGQVRAAGRLPGYLADHLVRWGFDVRTVIHRDSPVQHLMFDAAPGWVTAMILAACWVFGAGVILAFFSFRDDKATMRGRRG